MAEPLKNFFNAERARVLAKHLASAHPAFPVRQFVNDATRALDGLELLDRGRQFARALRAALPESFPAAARIIESSLGQTLEGGEGNGMSPFIHLPAVMFVAEHGKEHFDEAMKLQHALTQRFSAEFSIRVFLDKDPERALKFLRRWVKDSSFHVRRLVSEGTRPRLPWAPRLNAFRKFDDQVLPLLDALKDDPELYVRRSVANHLNDISKENAARALDIAERWMLDASEDVQWVVRHALRWLAKKGDRRALRILGVGEVPKVKAALQLSARRAEIGGAITVTGEVANAAARSLSLVVHAAVHYVRANGEPKAKVFKLGQGELKPRELGVFARKISLAQMTTRQHHPGTHAVELRVNGVSVARGEFVLTPAGGRRVRP